MNLKYCICFFWFLSFILSFSSVQKWSITTEYLHYRNQSVSFGNHLLACRYLRQYRNGTLHHGCQFDTTDSILFIMNFHYNNYTPVHFIETGYFKEFSRRFKYSVDLVLVGPIEDESKGVYGTGTPRMGFYSYHSFSYAYDLFNPRRGFSYYGFMFLNDDSCLNPWVLNTLPFNVSYSEWGRKPVHNTTNWKFVTFKNTYGITNYQAVTEALKEMNDRNLHCGPYHVISHPYCARGDFFYVYRRHSLLIREIFQTMYKYRVFLEIAVPTALESVNASEITSCNHFQRFYKYSCGHYHPTKFSNMQMRTKCINRIINSTFYWE